MIFVQWEWANDTRFLSLYSYSLWYQNHYVYPYNLPNIYKKNEMYDPASHKWIGSNLSCCVFNKKSNNNSFALYYFLFVPFFNFIAKISLLLVIGLKAIYEIHQIVVFYVACHNLQIKASYIYLNLNFELVENT